MLRRKFFLFSDFEKFLLTTNTPIGILKHVKNIYPYRYKRRE